MVVVVETITGKPGARARKAAINFTAISISPTLTACTQIFDDPLEKRAVASGEK